ncbi:PREDICTED: tax1-binding protein 1 isoform X2 [Nanorana parkeri]|uniref:tax1-binding protein 1 isoform X2 n=1 Tax=Nanorana parkeri TaxID=125878 RepID=UPI00085425BC|nr:PREDICTED: tax1-binding protein 1 isoform X2 [Nanorana parkeri]
MSALQDHPSPNSSLQTSNFAHVIFQNVAKSYLPSAPLECHYTLTQYIHPNPKDWVGIFKVGWSTARDYYTFLWSPMPEDYVPDCTRDCVLTFQGYYLPNDDGEFYQFCYVTHKGEIRGASTPFQFRSSSPVDELLTMEDEGHSDMLVVTTKAGLLELKIEKTMKEKEELQKITAILEKETVQLRQQVENLESELSRERECSEQLSSERDQMLQTTENLKSEGETEKKACQEMSAKILQLEEDLLSVTQKAIEKETELDSLKDKLKKMKLEREQLEFQVKNEKDEKELYKVHLKNTEIENTKLLTEVQTLKNLDANKENLISHYKEELGKTKLCLDDKDKVCKDLLLNCAEKEDIGLIKRQLRKIQDEHQASRQEVSFMSRELSDAVTVRDKTMSDLHTSRLETESVKKQLADALSELSIRDTQRQMTTVYVKKEQDTETGRVEQELRKEVEDLKLRLQMAADHYKDKFKECQKLQKQVVKLTEQLNAEEKQKGVDVHVLCQAANTEASNFSPSVNPFSSDCVPEFVIKEQVADMSKEIAEKSEKYLKCKQMLAEEKEKCSALADSAGKMEVKWKEQLKVNESIKLQVAAIEDQYKIQSAEKDREISELSCHVEVLLSEKGRLEDTVKELEINLERLSERMASGHTLSGSSSQGLQFFNPYCEEHRSVPIIPIQPPVLQFGNPYASQSARDGADGAFNPDDVQGPPAQAPLWEYESKVVCSQPARNLSRPDGLEDPDDNNQDNDDMNFQLDQDPPSYPGQEQSGFCFDPRYTMQRKCPLCTMVFPPNYKQSHFEEHVESHWKVCPMCNEQFPLYCDQQAFERHVQTHFDGNILNFE